MDEQFWWGVLAGMVFFGGLWAASTSAYKQALMLCAAAKTAEKLPDGRFYYMVEESEYVRRFQA